MNESNNAKNETSPSSKTAAEIRVDVFGRTDVGLVREHNEDNFLIADLSAGNRNIKPEVRQHIIGEKGSIFVVCDGMGGAAAGEVASQIGVDTIYDMMQNGDPPRSEEELAQRLEKAISEAGRRIHTAAKINRAQRGMGTTVTAAALIDERLLVGQVGDSRAYILRGRQFVQITKDQSLVQQLIDAKQMTEEEARSFDKNNIILQALGTAEEVHVDMTSVVLKSGDRLVICSDGLCGLVENEAIGQIVYDSLNPLEACRVLTEQACESGGYDNITVIVAAFDGSRLDDPLPEGDIDESLIYDRYSFSRESETTSRKMRPNRSDPGEVTNETNLSDVEEPDEGEADEIPKHIEIADFEEDIGGSGKSLFGTVALVLLAILGGFIYFSTRTPQDAAVSPPSVSPSPPTITPPPIPTTQPSTPPASAETGDGELPVRSTAIEKSQARETEQPAPQLPPTPEEAITKTSKNHPAQNGLQEAGVKTNRSTRYPPTLSEGTAESGPFNEREPETDSSSTATAKPTQPATKTPEASEHKTPNIAPEETPTEASPSTPAKKKTKDAAGVKTVSPQKASPKPIADNPFDGT